MIAAIEFGRFPPRRMADEICLNPSFDQRRSYASIQMVNAFDLTCFNSPHHSQSSTEDVECSFLFQAGALILPVDQ